MSRLTLVAAVRTDAGLVRSHNEDAVFASPELLCSDGLTDLVGDTALAAALAIPSRERCAERLVELALAAGGRDNVSVIVADAIPAAQRAA